MQNKRGQGLSTNAIILIILGVLVLAVLIVGFTMGWKTIAPWLEKDNVENIVTSCGTACATLSVYDYCSRERDLISGDLPADSEGKIQKEVAGNCTFFATDTAYVKYGVEECPGLCA
jgi:hypothetical protein